MLQTSKSIFARDHKEIKKDFVSKRLKLVEENEALNLLINEIDL